MSEQCIVVQQGSRIKRTRPRRRPVDGGHGPGGRRIGRSRRRRSGETGAKPKFSGRWEVLNSPGGLGRVVTGTPVRIGLDDVPGSPRRPGR